MKSWKLGQWALVLGALALTAGCADDDDLVIPLERGPGGALFDRYVSLGNSITAGYQSGGINDSTQAEAYPVLLANQARARFNVPDIARPGCPPPLRDPFSGQRISPVPCALRSNPEPGPIQNLAVPGARIVDALNNLVPQSAANALTTFILGGRTQLEALQDAEPTLVSAFLGNNDALGAALTGNIALLTPLPEFQGTLGQLIAGIQASTAQQAVLIGPVDPQFTPALQPGAYFFVASQPSGGTFLGKRVNANCSPVTATGQPNPLAGNLVSFSIFTTQIPEISCADDAPLVLNLAEQTAVSARVAAFNQAIEAAATQAGYVYLNPNTLLVEYLDDTNPQGLFNRIRKCQALAGARTAQEIQRAVLVSCPVTGPTQAPNFFGSFFSFDGVHPSREGHQVIANALATAINDIPGQEGNIPTVAIPAIR